MSVINSSFCPLHNIILHIMYLVTSDVQSVSATVVDESTIAIQCLFLHGSDALGCKVVVVSNCSNISDVYANLLRNNSVIMSASGKLNLVHNIFIIECLHLTLTSTTLSVISLLRGALSSRQIMSQQVINLYILHDNLNTPVLLALRRWSTLYSYCCYSINTNFSTPLHSYNGGCTLCSIA